MPSREELYDLARRAVRRYGVFLFQSLNVHGVGVGHKEAAGSDTGEPCVVVFVGRKLPSGAVPESLRIPARLAVGPELVRTDVREGGPFFPQQNTARIRPAQPGTSIGEVSITAGTFGGVVTDNQTGEALILSNNHVLADSNQAPIGSAIVQPGPFDGGRAPADTIATLLRYIPLTAGSNNLVDAAVALPTTPSVISNVPLNGVPAPSPSVPAVGLIFSGDGVNTSNLNPIQTVLTMLEIGFPQGASVTPATVGMALQKTGRTTMKTIGNVITINSTVRVDYGGGLGVLTFVDQIVTTKMSEGGDSGSVAVVN